MSGIDASTVLMLHCDGTDASTSFPDDSASAHTVTANGDAQVDTAQSVFGGASALFDGTDDWLSIPYDSDFDFGTDDCCIDLRIRFASTLSAGSGFFATRVQSSPRSMDAYWEGGTVRFRDYSNTIYTDTFNPTANQWYHFAFVRKSGVGHIYIDGVRRGTGTLNNQMGVVTALNIGRMRDSLSGYRLNGWIDEFRISKGSARIDDPSDPLYIASGNPADGFTVPAAEYSVPPVCARVTLSRDYRVTKSPRISIRRDITLNVYDAKMKISRDYRADKDARIIMYRSHRAYTNAMVSIVRDVRTWHDARATISRDHRVLKADRLDIRRHSFSRSGYAVYAREIDSGATTYLGFINSGTETLSGISLADGTYQIEARPCRDFWDACRYAKYLYVVIADGEIVEAIPAVTNLSATWTATGTIITWQWPKQFGVTNPTYFDLWYSDTVPVDTEEDAVSESVSYFGPYYRVVYRGALDYVTVMARGGTQPVSLELPIPAIAPVAPVSQWSAE